jgi:hypothetical protein
MSTKLLPLFGLLAASLGVEWDARAADLELLNFNLGGGLTVPLNPTARFVGVNGSATTGAGVNIDKKNSIEGDFMWNGLSPGITLAVAPVEVNGMVFHPMNVPNSGSINVFSLTGEYRFHIDGIAHSAFGIYLIGGGGWYYRHTDINKNVTPSGKAVFSVPPFTVCQPIYEWWGFACDSRGFVFPFTIVSHGNSAGGVNAGAGFSIRLDDEGWKFFVESRYNYAWSNFIPTTFVPVTFGLRFN